MYARIKAACAHVFRTSAPFTSAPLGDWDDGTSAAVPRRERYVAGQGAFSERYARIARPAHVRPTRRSSTRPILWLGQIEARLAEKRYAAVTVVQSETSTGVLTEYGRKHSRIVRTMCLVIA